MLLPDFIHQASEYVRQFFTINPSEPFTTGAKLTSMVGTAVTGGAVLATKTYPWLKAKYDSRSISKSVGAKLFSVAGIEASLRYYVPAFCQSVDPAGDEESRRIPNAHGKLFDALDSVLSKSTEERYHILLADSGMGKTSALLNYYARHLHRWRKPCKLAIVPLGVSDADERIDAIQDKEETAIFLDAFDEDTLALVDHSERLRLIIKQTRSFYKVLITSRTQFFARDEELPGGTGIMKVAARRAGESAEYVFHKIYLTPFTDEQVISYLKRRYPLWHLQQRRRALALAKKIPHLTARPMLLAHLDDLVREGGSINYSFELYEAMIEGWIRREQGFIDNPHELRRFSELLAVDLYVNRQTRGSELIKKAELVELAKKWKITIVDYRLSGRSLLNRDADGNFKFAHRSIMEYLFLRRFVAGDADCRNIEWTDNMKRFLVEMLAPLAESFCFPLDLSGADLRNIAQAGFSARRRIRSAPTTLEHSDLNRLLRRITDADSSEHLFSISTHRHDDVIFDWNYGLMWQRSGSEDLVGSGQAFDYLKKVNKKKYYGYDDWRLPTLEEALLGSDFPGSRSPTPDRFFDPRQSRIWTSDRFPGGAHFHALLPAESTERDNWIGDFYVSREENITAFVRAVRSEGPAPQRLVPYGDPLRYRKIR